ncbi:MAG: hypothetical protein JZU63_12315, partial [Rhodoferax sp.]|nr:hypothetical protein [Rhodoferax sp.]
MVNVFALSSSVFSMIVYDRVIPNNATDTLYALMIGVFIIFVGDFFIRTVRGYFLDMASSKADAAIADIQDGAVLMLGGFGLCGIPENCIAAL